MEAVQRTCGGFSGIAQYQLVEFREDDASLYPITQIAWDDSTNFVAYPDEKAPPRKWPNPVCDEPPQPDYAGRS